MGVLYLFPFLSKVSRWANPCSVSYSYHRKPLALQYCFILDHKTEYLSLEPDMTMPISILRSQHYNKSLFLYAGHTRAQDLNTLSFELSALFGVLKSLTKLFSQEGQTTISGLNIQVWASCCLFDFNSTGATDSWEASQGCGDRNHYDLFNSDDI